MIKLLHTGDLHLDSPFSSLTPAQSEERRRQLRETFADMIDLAESEKVDLVLIAGDLFDCGFVYKDTLTRLCQRFAALSCPVVIAPGNHDPYTPESLYASGKMPPNVHIFTKTQPETLDFPRLGVTVTGYAFHSDRYEGDPLAGLTELPRDRMNILLAHTELDAPLSVYAPIAKTRLGQSGFCYAALGHVHLDPAPKQVGNTVCAYCGMAEGRSFDEPGYGGVNLVTLERQPSGITVEVCRQTLSRRRYMVDTLDVSGALSDDDVAEKLSQHIAQSGYGKETSLRVRLVGTVALSYTPDTAALSQRVGEPLYLLQVKDQTAPLLDSEYLAHDKTIRGELYRVLQNQLNGGNEQERQVASLALRYALLALDGNLNV